jgi:hypothetical protein
MPSLPSHAPGVALQRIVREFGQAARLLPGLHGRLQARAAHGMKGGANMSEIMGMNDKIRALINQPMENMKPHERVAFEMLVTYTYIEGFRDGYAKGYVEANLDGIAQEGKER